MGRGKKWTAAETKVLVEAFIHLSENALVGTDQSSEQLYRRVSEEAKTRYEGDWVRSGDACKKRWSQVSREVMRFCSSMKFVKTIEKPGWNDSDYFNHAKKYYCTRYGMVEFEYVAEWNCLKDFQKWKTHAPSDSKHAATSDSKRSAPQEDGDETKKAEEPAAGRSVGFLMLICLPSFALRGTHRGHSEARKLRGLEACKQGQWPRGRGRGREWRHRDAGKSRRG